MCQSTDAANIMLFKSNKDTLVEGESLIVTCISSLGHPGPNVQLLVDSALPLQNELTPLKSERKVHEGRVSDNLSQILRYSRFQSLFHSISLILLVKLTGRHVIATVQRHLQKMLSKNLLRHLNRL